MNVSSPELYEDMENENKGSWYGNGGTDTIIDNGAFCNRGSYCLRVGAPGADLHQNYINLDASINAASNDYWYSFWHKFNGTGIGGVAYQSIFIQDTAGGANSIALRWNDPAALTWAYYTGASNTLGAWTNDSWESSVYHYNATDDTYSITFNNVERKGNAAPLGVNTNVGRFRTFVQRHDGQGGSGL